VEICGNLSRKLELLNFLLAIYIIFSMIQRVESDRDIPRDGDGNTIETGTSIP